MIDPLGVGVEFVSRKSHPKFTRQQKAVEHSYDVKVGERLKIVSYHEDDDTYMLLNVSLCSSDAWFMVSKEELLMIREPGIRL